MSRIVVLSIAMLILGMAPGLTESNSQGIRVVTARDLLNYAEMPTFRNGVSWGMVVGQKNLYCTPPNQSLAPEQILTIMARYAKDNPIELDRNWELVMISALRDVFRA